MSTLANSNQKKRRLEGKDLITIGIYSYFYPVNGSALSLGWRYSLYVVCH